MNIEPTAPSVTIQTDGPVQSAKTPSHAPLNGAGSAPEQTGLVGTTAQDQTSFSTTSSRNQASDKPSPTDSRMVAYHVDERTKEVYFEVVDQASGQVVRQVPPEAVLNNDRRLAELLAKKSEPTESA
jgi:hypothetical protein